MSFFYIKSCLNDYVLDIPRGNRDNCVQVVTSPRKEDSLLSDNQLWQLDYQPDGTFLIISKMHGKVLDCGGQTQGTKLILWDRHGGNNQRFRKEGNYIVSLSGLTLDIAGSNTAPGAHVILWSRKHPPSKNQLFELEPFVNFFYIKSCLNDYVLDIPRGNHDNGVQVVTSPQKEDSLLSDNQLWQLDYQPDGTFLIISKMHGKVLDCGGQTQGTKLILWDRHGGKNQQFRKEGSYIVSLSGLTLDIAGSNTAPGTHVILWTRKHPPSKNQMFELEPFVNQKPTSQPGYPPQPEYPPQPGYSQPVPHQHVPNMAENLRMDGVPTLMQLLKFPTESGPINVVQNIAEFTKFGILLLNDDMGAMVADITEQNLHNAEKINTEILRRWLQGSGQWPVEWQTLVECLEQSGHKILAETIKDGLKKSENVVENRILIETVQKGPEVSPGFLQTFTDTLKMCKSDESAVSQLADAKKVKESSILEEDDLIDVKREVISLAAKWRDLGLALRLKPADLETIGAKHQNNPTECLTDTLRTWLQLGYDREKHGPPTWDFLSKAVRDHVGGNNPSLADAIAKSHST